MYSVQCRYKPFGCAKGTKRSDPCRPQIGLTPIVWIPFKSCVELFEQHLRLWKPLHKFDLFTGANCL